MSATAGIDFLHKDNSAGQTLLSLVGRGSAIIAELLRLSDHIPSVFRGSPNDPAERAKYSAILFDFKYLKAAELVDAKIESDSVRAACSVSRVLTVSLRAQDLVDLDEEFRETHLALLKRFYKMFESIYRYVADFATYLDELQEGVFLQHSVEVSDLSACLPASCARVLIVLRCHLCARLRGHSQGVLMDVEGRQLMCEALYLYGVMLLLLDVRIDGATRERMIVSFIRYKEGQVNTIDEVCRLCRTTGFVAGKRPPNYPEEYFAR